MQDNKAAIEGGWKYDYDFLQKLASDINRRNKDNHLSMEDVEDVLLAINYSPSPVQGITKEGWKQKFESWYFDQKPYFPTPKQCADWIELNILTDDWVSVEEGGYPKKNKGVLVFIPEEDYHITSGMWDVSEKWVLLDEYRVPECKVTHWMDIPKVPKEYEKEIQENYKVMKWLSDGIKSGEIKAPERPSQSQTEQKLTLGEFLKSNPEALGQARDIFDKGYLRGADEVYAKEHGYTINAQNSQEYFSGKFGLTIN